MSPLHLSYRLTRRQQLAAHVGIWWRYPIALVGVTGTLIAVVLLAVRFSAWFLLLLCFPLPPFNNVPRLVAGFVRPLLWGRCALDVAIENDRLGYRAGREYLWAPLDTVDGVYRFRDDTWTISFQDGPLISIPVAAIDARYIEHIRNAGTAGAR